MTVRRWMVLVLLLLVLTLVFQVVRTRNLLEASRLLHQVEQVSVSLAASGRANPAIYWNHVEFMEMARGLNPVDSRILLAEGSQYLLLGRPEEAVEVYRRALEIEPRPEIYLNLGRAEAAAGQLEEARESFRRAAALDPRNWRLIPQELRPSQVPGKRPTARRKRPRRSP
ncbi:MAG: tetratricopeptide repeat protein [Acidobacteriota bacterium]